MPKLANKIALVTGASKGIGAAIAKALAAEGAAVVVNYASSKAGADKVVDAIRSAGGEAIAVQADLAEAEDVTRLFAETQKAFGRLDVLVNNAGVYQFGPLEGVTEAEIHRQFNINVVGLLLATQQAVKLFPDSGGNVINVSSVISTNLPPTSAVYSATKAAVDAITRVLAKELGPKRIRVNAINPGGVETEGFHAAGIKDSDFERQMIAGTPLGRLGQPDDVARVATFLASDDSAWVTGELIVVAGGYR
jgi:3-oxoacyl-[acyl-carrier protein] reductase